MESEKVPTMMTPTPPPEGAEAEKLAHNDFYAYYKPLMERVRSELFPTEMAEIYIHYISGFERGYAAGLKAAEGRWISVKEGLPEINQDESGNHPHLHEYLQSDPVIAFFKDGDMDDQHVFTGRFVSVLREKHLSKHEQWFESDSEGSVDFEDISHWMPLPPGPGGTEG